MELRGFLLRLHEFYKGGACTRQKKNSNFIKSCGVPKAVGYERSFLKNIKTHPVLELPPF
jgi:hypothetical protein